MKNNLLRKAVPLLAVFMLMSCGGAVVAPPGVNSKLTTISINDTAGSTIITIQTSSLPQYATFVAQSPPSVTLDLASTDASGVSKKLNIDNGFVKKITVKQLGVSTGYSSRIVVTLERPLPYNVSVQGNDIVLSITKSKHKMTALLPPTGQGQTVTTLSPEGIAPTGSTVPELLAPEALAAGPTTGPEGLAPMGEGMSATAPAAPEALAPEALAASPMTGPEGLAPMGEGMSATAPAAPEALVPEALAASPTTGPEGLAPMGEGMSATAPAAPEALAPEALAASPTTGPEGLAPMGEGMSVTSPAVTEQPIAAAQVSPSVSEQPLTSENTQTSAESIPPVVTPQPTAPAPEVAQQPEAEAPTPVAPPTGEGQEQNEQLAMVTPAPAVPAPVKAMRIRKDIIETSVPLVFKSNQAILSVGAETSLKDVANYLLAHGDIRVVIAGYSDANGSESYNKELSFYRATWVKLILEKYGVSSRQIVLRPMGETTKFGHTKSTYRRNRRVVLTIAR